MRRLLIKISLMLVAIMIAGYQEGRASDCFGRDYREAADSSVEYYNDGPHVLWQNDTTVIVFYLCHGEMEHRALAVKDTIRFEGFCRDAGIEYFITSAPHDPGPQEYHGVSKIMALSDIHGEYQAFEDFLKVAGVIDDDCHWAWGDGHLVIAGDVFDRGDMVTECLWLVYRLEQEAKRSGGAVHYLGGNHELMVMQDDLRYVNSKYMDGLVKKSRIAYSDLYGPDTESGRWLRSKHTAVKINDILFVHAGISPYIVDAGYGLSAINETARENIDLSSSQMAFNDRAKLFYGSRGPFWYRGYFEESEGRYPAATAGDIDRILSFYEVVAMVVGHSETDSLSGFHDNRIIAIDVPVDELGTFEAMLWQDGRFYRVKGSGQRVLIRQ